MRIFGWRIRRAIFAAVCLLVAQSAIADQIDYVRDVKPILKSRCYACHGPLKQRSGLRLDAGRLIQQGGDDGAAVVPGKPDESPLVARISAQDASERMPPEGEPLTTAQIELLKQWIVQGAASPEDEQPEPDPREHWAFRPPQRPAVPAAAETEAGQNPIDAFLADSLARRGLTPSGAAPKHVLLRRVYLDLIGLPPTRDELLAFLADESPSAYEAIVDRLLDDPRHGERWGRHWMDVWRYSDWYGRRDVNDVRNSASQIWRWRDWIVRSINEDKGYDRMIREMLAADEIFPEDYEAGVATGYLIRNYYSLNPNDWMRSAVEHTGKAFLGLTFNCAHCHDHKYDPISHDDYFRMRAFFEPISIRQDRVAGEADPGIFQDYTYSGTRAVQRLGVVRIFDKTPDAPTWFYTGGDERNRVTQRGSIPPGVPAFLENTALTIEPVKLPPRAWYPGLREEIQQTVLADARTALARDETELAAAKTAATDAPADLPEQLARAGTLRLKAAEAKVAAARAELASVEARIAADRAKFGETSSDEASGLTRDASRLEREATLKNAESEVLAGELAVLDAEAKPADDANRAKAIDAATNNRAAASAAVGKTRAALADEKLAETYSAFSPMYPQESTGRRRALAEWIASRDNPLTARVAANHIWMRHFHTPLVASVYDFGRNGAQPTHPELLDWLAVEFMEAGWNMKHLHRLIVTSDAYRRASVVGEATQNVTVDPENKLLWRMNVGRMESEVVRDSLLYCAGRLDRTMGGVELENDQALTTNRRSLYYSVHPEAGGKSALGELFDAPNPLDCYRRTTSIVPQQALALTNSDLVHQMSAAIVSAWDERAGETQADQFVAAMFEQVLTRTPTEVEQRLCRDALEKQQQLSPNPGSAEAVVRARESLVRILLNHNDFVTIR